MKHAVNFLIVSCIIICSVLVFSCSDSERRLPYLSKNTATVIINLGLPGEQASASTSIINRILRFFTRDAVAQTAPATFSGYTVRVTASDMTTMEQAFTSSIITLTVPAGSSRTFEVIASVSASDPSAAQSFSGKTTLDLTAGQTVSVPVTMNLYETKIVIPDYLFNKIVQINSLSDGNATWKTNTLGYVSSLYPYDIDFDARGRIYVARYSGSDTARILRINNMDSTTADTIVTLAGGVGVRAIAIDRKNHILYYETTGSILNRVSCDGGTSTTLARTGSGQTIQYIYGMAYDETENVLYLAGTNATSQSSVFKYSIASTSVTAYNSNTSILNTPRHVLVQYPNIYVANHGGDPGYKIVQLNSSLQYVQGYGNTATVANTSQGMFYGAYRFLAILNRKITILDDGYDLDKLISMDNINGDGWTTYGNWSYTAGIGYFRFYTGT